MKIRGLSINGKFLAAQPTGVHRVAKELIHQIARHKEELTTLFGAPPTILAPRNAALGEAPADLPARCDSVLTGQLWEQIELPIRARNTLLLSFCNLAPLLHSASIPMLHDAQTFSTPQSYSRAFRSFYRLIQPAIGARALRVLTVSEYSRAELVRYGIAPAERIRVIHNGVDHGQLLTPDQSIVARLGLMPGRYVLALASTQTHKNIRVLLEAFSKHSLPGLKLVLFGSAGPAQFAAAGMNTSESVVFTGRVSDSELTALMETALCFAMPSITEGFGLPPLEAMALGCPAVVSPCGALPEVCGGGALYVASDRADLWRETFAQLSGNPRLRLDMVGRGLRQASIMTWSRAGDQLMEVLRAIASGRQAR